MATTTARKKALSRRERLARERQILTRFDVQNRPAFLAARRARTAKRVRKAAAGTHTKSGGRS